jgi:uncharacterized protein
VNLFFCDTSALGKRYVPEVGTPLVSHFFVSVPDDRRFILMQALGELLSIIVRRRNSGALSAQAYAQAIQALRDELVVTGRIRLRPSDLALVLASLPLIEKYSINSTDALVLASALDLEKTVRPAGHSVVLVASDLRLLNAAVGEGLTVFNPETAEIAELEALMAAP